MICVPMSNSDNIKKDKDILISEENKNVSNSNGIIEQKEYKSLLMELPEHVKYNQAEQILNYSDNNHNGYLPLLTMYLNCLDV
jgi:hypothetical protein